MDVSNLPLIKQKTWDEVRHDVKKVNPEITQIIDNLSPSKKLKFISASYGFGDIIIKKGKVQLPLEHKAELKNTLQTYGLDYAAIPLALLLDKSSEIFITENKRVIPLKVFLPGMLFGTFEMIDHWLDEKKPKLWEVSAGSRSLFTLPKISDHTSLRRLFNHYKISYNTPVLSIADHSFLFKEIAQSQCFTQPWKSHVLFFTKSWMNFKKDDPAWFNFQRYIFKQAWVQSKESMLRYEFAINWQLFIKYIAFRRMQPIPYFMDTIKHLMLIAAGESPAFRPAENSDVYAPIKGLQDALLNVYQLNKYAPVIMHTEMLKKNSFDPVYYSMAFPTLLEGTPESKCQSSTIMLDLKNIKRLIDINSKASEPLKNGLDAKKFDYFHVEKDQEYEILLSSNIINTDERFLMHDREFCATSAFWRGCIRVHNAKV